MATQENTESKGAPPEKKMSRMVGLLLIVLCQLPVAGQEKPSLVFVAQATKSAYLKSEPMEVHFTLKNVGRDPVIVVRRLHLTLSVQLRISNSQGKQAKWCGRIAEVIPMRGSYTELAPGQSIRSELNISCVNEDDPQRAWGYRLNRAGRYVIEASYRLTQPQEELDSLFPGSHVIRGPIMAAPVTVELR